MKRGVLAIVGVLALLVVWAPAARATDDPFWPQQWGPVAIHAPEAWSVTRGKGVTIAIVDTGVELKHSDLQDKLVAGYDFADDDNDPNDVDQGHGTHVAGIAAASTDNGIGIAGVAPDAKIMPVRVALSGEASSSATGLIQIEQAVDYAASNGAKVINLSLGEDPDNRLTPQGFDTVSRACLDAYNKGALCVAAAGNAGRGKPSGYAEDFPGIVVAASDDQGVIADFSQSADTKWAVTAPGVLIYSSWLKNGYQYEQGTSMAAPHVTGVAALLFSQGKSIDQVVDKIVSTATPMNDGGAQSGAGMLNAAAAVGAPYTPAAAPAGGGASTPTTVAPATQGGGSHSTATTVAGATGPTTPATLVEGTVEEGGDFSGGKGSDFDAALGDAIKAPEPISTSGGITLPFVVAIIVFAAILGGVGFVARRIVLRRGIGEIS
jgi:subtilisin family serine protease